MHGKSKKQNLTNKQIQDLKNNKRTPNITNSRTIKKTQTTPPSKAWKIQETQHSIQEQSTTTPKYQKH